MKMKSFILKYASKLMFYDVNIACYHTRSLITTRVKKGRVSGLRSMAYLATRGRCWSAGSSSHGRRHDHDHDRDLLPSDGGRSSQKWITIKSSSYGRRSITKNSDRSPIVTRSRRDRSSIVTRSRRDQSSIVPRLGPLSAWNRFHSIGRRATRDQDHDHGPIAARSWPDRGTFEAQIETNLPQIRELRCCPRESRPRPRKTAPTTASITHEFGLISLFKKPCTPSLFLNF